MAKNYLAQMSRSVLRLKSIAPRQHIRCYKRKKKMLVTQACLTLSDPMDCSLSGSSVCGILQARILEWVSIPFSRGSSRPKD